MAGFVAGRPVRRLALSSRSLVERDDRAKRIILSRDGMWVGDVRFEQLVTTRLLSGNDRDTMEVPHPEGCVSNRAAGT